MRRPSFRVRVWMLLLLVAVAGGAFGAYRLYRRAEMFREQAVGYAEAVTTARTAIKEYGSSIRLEEKRRDEARELARRNPREAESYEARAEQHEAEIGELRRWLSDWQSALDEWSSMARAYDRAAKRPWLSAPPDRPQEFR